MKKTIPIIFCVNLLAFTIGGCTANENAKASNREVIELVKSNDVDTWNVHYYIFRDTENKQEYVVFKSNDGGLTVIPRLPKEVRE